MTKKENIQNLWKQYKGSKTKFKELCAKEFNRSAGTIHTHWFANLWQIPKEFEDRVIELLQNAIKQHNKVTA